MIERSCLVVGSSDGIGLELVRLVVGDGWRVVGISRRASGRQGENHEHVVLDVTDPHFRRDLSEICERLGPFDAVVYCAGVGELLDPHELASQRVAFEVNLLGAVDTFEIVAPGWIAARRGHFVVLSSLADRLIGPVSPGYNASKAAVTSYFESLALAMKQRGVAISVVRFGFVDTKMAKSPVRPFMMSRERAARTVQRVLATRPLQYSAPWAMAALLFVVEVLMRLRFVLG